MATYRIVNIVLELIDLSSIRAEFDVERLNGDWVLVKTATISTAVSRNALEIAKEIGEAAKQIARKDSLIDGIFDEVLSILSGKEFEI